MKVEAVLLLKDNIILCEYWNTTSIKIKRVRTVVQRFDDRSDVTPNLRWHQYPSDDLYVIVCLSDQTVDSAPLADEIYQVFLRENDLDGHIVRVVRQFQNSCSQALEQSLDSIESQLKHSIDKILDRGESLNSLSSGAAKLREISKSFAHNVDALQLLQQDEVYFGAIAFAICLFIYYLFSSI